MDLPPGPHILLLFGAFLQTKPWRVPQRAVDRTQAERYNALNIAYRPDQGEVRHRVRVLEASGHLLPRPSQGALSGDWSDRQPASPASDDSAHGRAADAARRGSQHAGVNWLATEREKVAHFFKRYDGRIGLEDLPQLVFEQDGQRTIRYFPDKLPIAVGTSRQVLFLYVVTDPNPEPIRRFMRSHRRVLERIYAWHLRLVFPGHLAGCQRAYRAAIDEFLAPPLPFRIVDEFGSLEA